MQRSSHFREQLEHIRRGERSSILRAEVTTSRGGSSFWPGTRYTLQGCDATAEVKVGSALRAGAEPSRLRFRASGRDFRGSGRVETRQVHELYIKVRGAVWSLKRRVLVPFPQGAIGRRRELPFFFLTYSPEGLNALNMKERKRMCQ